MGNFKPADDFGGINFDSDDVSDGERTFKGTRGAASDLNRRADARIAQAGRDSGLIGQAGD